MSVTSIRVGRITVPPDELQWRFDTSGGPGGQHANKSATRVELSWDLGASTTVPDDLRKRMLSRLGSRAANGVVTVTAGDTRSQWRNRAIARHRMEEILTDAMRIDPHRIPTGMPSAARRRRLERKRRRAEIKKGRRAPGEDGG